MTTYYRAETLLALVYVAVSYALLSTVIN